MQKYDKYRTSPNFSWQLTRVQQNILTYLTKRELSSKLIISSFSILPPIPGFRNYLPSAGVALRFTTCLWSATPSEFWLLSPIKTGVTLRSPLPMVCQPFGLAFFSRASYKEYDSPCSSDWPRTDCTRPLPRAHDTVKFWFIIGLNSVIDFGRFNLTPIDTQSIPDHYPNMTARWDRGWAEARGKIRAIFYMNGVLFALRR